MLPGWSVLVGAVIGLIGTVRYIGQTIGGQTRPNRMTWLMWSLAPLVAFVAERHAHVGWSQVMTLSVGLGPLAVFVASFANRDSYWRVGALDVACGLISLGGLAIYLATRRGDIAVIAAITADLAAGAPTLVKIHRHPETESFGPFVGGATNALIALGTITSWTFVAAGFPMFIAAYDLSAVCLLAAGRRRALRR